MNKRATASKTPGSAIGIARYKIYKNGIGRIQNAIKSGYYLEAITLCESLIADRLESRLKYLTGGDKYSFKTLGDIQKGIKKYETDSELRSIINSEVNKWRQKRNDALHAIGKLEEKKIEIWEDRIEKCKKIAEDGEKLRKRIFSIIDKLKK